MKTPGIYKIENVTNGRFYVGSAIVIRKRLSLMYEQLVIDGFGRKLYNLAPRAGSQLGFRHSDESKK